LGEIVFGLRFFRLVLYRAEGWEKQTNQNRNDCDNNQQFNESEGAVRPFL
jgi:hypothetical protein